MACSTGSCWLGLPAGYGVSQGHLKCNWTTNRSSLKVFGAHKLHAAIQKGGRSPKEITMTMLNNTSNYSAAPAAIRTAIRFFAAGFARFINRWVAAMIAHRQRQANL